MNSVQLVGNLTKDPEMRETTNGIKACNFTVACRRRFKNASGEYESDFINCVAWRQTAELVHKYFAKGSKIALTGSLQTRSYDAHDGSKRHVIEVLCDSVEFVQAKSQNSQNGASIALQNDSTYTQVPTQDKMVFVPVNVDDELPF